MAEEEENVCAHRGSPPDGEGAGPHLLACDDEDQGYVGGRFSMLMPRCVASLPAAAAAAASRAPPPPPP